MSKEEIFSSNNDNITNAYEPDRLREDLSDILCKHIERHEKDKNFNIYECIGVQIGMLIKLAYFASYFSDITRDKFNMFCDIAWSEGKDAKPGEN